MFWISTPKRERTLTPRKNKVLSAIKKKKQTNPDVSYIINPHSREKMQERHITQRDVVRSIEEFDNMYESRERTVVEKRLGGQILRTIFSMWMDKKVNVISTMHINEKKFNKSHVDAF